MKEKKQKNNKQSSPLKRWLYRILFLIALGVFLYSAYQLFTIFYQNYEESSEIERITEVAKVPEDPEKEAFTIDWDALKEKNEEVIGWILVPDTNISYPMVKGKDNDFYLTHTFEKKSNYAGSIFMDAFAQDQWKDRNTLIYGHNVKHGTMFAQLEKFKDKDFYENHPYIYIFTPEGNYRTEVISMYSTKSDSETYTTQFGSDESYMKYIENIKGLAEVKKDVKVEAKDKIITLSTCSYELNGQPSDMRYVLHALLVPWTGTYTKE